MKQLKTIVDAQLLAQLKVTHKIQHYEISWCPKKLAVLFHYPHISVLHTITGIRISR